MTTGPVVLLVDDDHSVTNSLSTTLAFDRESWHVISVNRAQEGLEVLRSTSVDVVVSDEQMPEMAGSEFLTIARDEFPDVMRIILTGQASVEATIAAINEARVFRFLTKPCPPDEFVACIDEALAARQAGLAATVDESLGETDDALDATFTEALAASHLAFQPILATRGLRLYAYEALIRSDHPTMPSPAELLRVAGLLDRERDLDRHVRQMVADTIASADDELSMFVNLHPISLGDPALLDGSDPLDAHAERIVLEVTERAQLGESGQVTEHLGALRGRGYRIALDDFGAGYNGLNNFAAIQPDVVKFDMDLVRDIERSPTKSGLVSSMVSLCRQVGILTVGEGIETADEYDHLVAMGCDLFQGYAIGKPQPPWSPGQAPS